MIAEFFVELFYNLGLVSTGVAIGTVTAGLTHEKLTGGPNQ